MKIHEYQAKDILERHGVAVPDGKAVTSGPAAENAARDLGGDLWVVKAQIHAGGRGKGRFKGEVSEQAIRAAARGDEAQGNGGVRLCRSPEEVGAAAEAMIGATLVTKQTGIEGQRVSTVYVEQGSSIATEFYLSVLLDRGEGRVLFMASSEGGMDIEEVAEEHPEAIHKVWVDPVTGLGGWQARQIAFGLGLQGKAVRSASKLLQGLYATYVAMDCSMLEINPLVLTDDDEVLALDCKMTFDDNALYRHRDLEELRDLTEEDPAEVEAGEYGLSFVNLDGNIGCLVNGAGLAMSTMDIIKYYGGEPANFLDVGGGADAEQVAAAFRIITRDERVKGILVNIFGGIMKCDTIANGVIDAVKEVGLQVPLVVRLAGTNVDKGKYILEESDVDIIPASNLDEAAKLITEQVGV